MPQIGLHMVIASQIADAGDVKLLRDHIGAFLLGSTSPDVRVMTRQDRKTTHFFDLNVMDPQDSIGGLFAEYPSLADPERLNAETRAWMCGYIAHLVMDENYINGVYRPFFAEHDRLGGQLRANAMDRVLQFYLDNTYCDPMDVRTYLSDSLRISTDTIETVFLESVVLSKWHKLTTDVASGGMESSRMRSMMANFLKFSGMPDEEERNVFLDGLPELLESSIEHVSRDEVDRFLERSRSAAKETVNRYLGREWAI
ncbi:hypothetical protein AYO38_08730 [bacterium SCGC AG-212-C10]|nr:hypothetical protein AYO38_08730 [bacterium SCGC AG-212-C10]